MFGRVKHASLLRKSTMRAAKKFYGSGGRFHQSFLAPWLTQRGESKTRDKRNQGNYLKVIVLEGDAKHPYLL
jgi:hypothetical protein